MSARRAVPIVLAFCVAAWTASSAGAAAPRLVMVSGPRLAAPVMLTDWREIGVFVQAVANESASAERGSLSGRPSLRLALFWDAAVWEPYIRERKLASLRPSDANQFGRFYPASRGRPAAIDLPWTGRWPKQPNERALAILARHGVPVAVGGGGDGGPAARWWIAAAAAGMLLAMAVALVLRRRTRANSVTEFPQGDSP